MKRFTALELIKKSAEVEKRLMDDLSHKIYNIRMEYAIYPDPKRLAIETASLRNDWQISKKLEDFLDLHKAMNIIVFGAGIIGYSKAVAIKYTKKYSNLNVILCDNNISKLQQGGGYGFDVISPAEAFKIENSVIIVGSINGRNEIYKQIIDSGYPKDRVLDLFFFTGVYGFQYFDYFEPGEHEIFVDGGSYSGGTAVQFTEWASKGYDYVYAFEANENMIDKCKDMFKEHNIKGEIINKGLWFKEDVLHFSINNDIISGSKIEEKGKNSINVISLDEFLNGKPVTFIKMDIEGAEFKALIGAEQTIKKYNPRLAISVYHKPEDILEIPALLLDMNENYKFALRTYFSNGTETILYAFE